MKPKLNVKIMPMFFRIRVYPSGLTQYYCINDDDSEYLCQTYNEDDLILMTRMDADREANSENHFNREMIEKNGIDVRATNYKVEVHQYIRPDQLRKDGKSILEDLLDE